MYRIDDATAATSLPTPEGAGTEGYFTEGNPATGTPATKVRASWLNMLQEELCAILAAAGITRSKTSYNQINSALQKMYAPIVGATRNASMTVAAAAATATFTADEIIVATALGGQTFKISSFSQTINLATTGAGGMDTGSAPTSGYVGLYAGYNPSTGTRTLFARNATSTVLGSVYGGSNAPAGYTATSLVSVWPTNGSGQLIAGAQVDRGISIPFVTVLTTSTTQASPTALSVSSAVPMNARKVSGTMSVSSTSSTPNSSLSVYAASSGVGIQGVNNSVSASGGISTNYRDLLITTSQTLYYSATSAAGTPTFTMSVSGYEI